MSERQLLRECRDFIDSVPLESEPLATYRARLNKRIDAALAAPEHAAPQASEQSTKGEGEAALPSSMPAGAAPPSVSPQRPEEDQKMMPLFYEWSHEASPYWGFSPTRERTVEVLLRAYKLGKQDGSVSPQAPTAFPWLPTDLHPATKNLVVQFAGALADKLYAAEKKYGYSDGWMADDWLDECRAKLREHVTKGDPRDVAAYCAFLWHHKASTLFASNVASAAPQGPTAEGADWVRVPRDALEKLVEVHRGWCNYCQGNAKWCMESKAKGGCSLRDLLSAAPRPDAGEGLVEEEESVDCPIHGVMKGSMCPRC